MTVDELVLELRKYASNKEVVICLDGEAMDISSVDFMDDEDWVTINS